MLITFSIVGYVFGAAVCGALFAAIGEANAATYDDSFTGDYHLDLLAILLWPLSLLVWAGAALGGRIGRWVVHHQ